MVYNTIIKLLVLLYGVELWTLCVKVEKLLERTEMRMLRRRKGDTLRPRERSKDIRKELGVIDIKEQVREIRMRWYGQ